MFVGSQKVKFDLHLVSSDFCKCVSHHFYGLLQGSQPGIVLLHPELHFLASLANNC